MPYQALGIDPTQVVESDGNPEFPLGSIGEDHEGNRYVYYRASGAVVEKMPVEFDINWDGADGAGVIADGIAMAALADNEYGWAQVGGVCENVNVATGVSAGDLLALLADGNGDLVGVSATSATTGAHNLRAKALEAESSGLADVLLYNLL